MRYLSVCSGIEAASVAWGPLGWKAVGVSEIEPFPCSVLKHHYPDVPNFGDMTKFEEWDIEPGSFDVLVGGTPCQSFSIAGLRGGLDDSRGNLALTYCRMLQKFKPRWFVWENVPGVISSKQGEDLRCILDAFGECGYIIDAEILDAQNFGVPQRRRRVFVCGENAEYLLRTKTTSSVLTMAQCLLEILHAVCKETMFKLENVPVKSELAHLSRDGVQRKMKLFGLITRLDDNSRIWQSFLGEECLKLASEVKKSVLEHGEKKDVDRTQDDLLMDFEMAVLSTLTEESWKNDWDDALEVARSFITSTSTNIITQEKICTCFRVVLSIASLTVHLKTSSPISYGAGLSAFAALQDFMNYARPANRDLFTNVDRISQITDLHRTARSLLKFIGCFGDWTCAAEALFKPGCVSRNSKKGSKKRPKVAALTASGVGTCGADDNQGQAGHLVAAPLTSRPYADNASHHTKLVAYQCQGTNVGAMGTFRAGNGNETGGVPFIATSSGDKAHCLNAGGMGRQDYETETMVVIPIDMRQASRGEKFTNNRSEGSSGGPPGIGIGGPGEPSPTVGISHTPAIAVSSFRTAGDGAVYDSGDKTAALTTATDRNANIVAFSGRERGDDGRGYGREPNVTGDITETVDATKPPRVAGPSVGVRRLTPEECEKLQGFPPGYTLVLHRGKPAADGNRYKSIGNSMAVPVMAWIGKRIDMVDARIKAEGTKTT